MITVYICLTVCVLIQSVYGVGLLVFGTPILLIWGLEFTTLLGLLLPSSVLLSILQIMHTKSQTVVETEMAPVAIIGVIAGIIILLQAQEPEQLPVIMAATMLFVAVMRSVPSAIHWIGNGLYRHRYIFHFLNAIFHGFTNQGGTLLSSYSTFVYREKYQALRCTSFFYLIYASAQIATLIAFGKLEIFFDGLLFMPVTAVIYIVLGRRSFKHLNQDLFFRLATMFFWLAAVVFFIKIPVVEQILNL